VRDSFEGENVNLIKKSYATSRLILLSLFATIGGPIHAQWSSPIPIDSSRYKYYIGGQLALDDSDNIYVTFNSSESNKLYVARSSDGGNAWTQYPFAGPELSRVPRDIVVDHLGNVWLLWLSFQDEFSPGVISLSRSSDGGKSFSTLFSSFSYADGGLYQKLAVDKQNSIYMLWDDAQFELTRFRYGDINQRFDTQIPNDTFSIDAHPALIVSKDFDVGCAWEGILNDTTGLHYFVFYSNSLDTGLTFQGKTLVDTSARSPARVIDSTRKVSVSYSTVLRGSEFASVYLSQSTNQGQTFGPPVLMSGTDSVYTSLLCIDSYGGVNLLLGVTYHG
jgi:hypothetical protein